jgi:hypothetical protein
MYKVYPYNEKKNKIYKAYPYAGIVAAHGAAFLDRHIQDWATGIYLNVLQLKNCDMCVLGQLFTSYVKGIVHLGLQDNHILGHDCDDPEITRLDELMQGRQPSENNVFELGFDLPGEYRRVVKDISIAAYADLTDAWREEIKNRLPLTKDKNV